MKAILLAAVLGIVAGAGSNLVSKIVYAAVVAFCGLVDLAILRTMASFWDAVWLVLAFNAALLGMSLYGYFFPYRANQDDYASSKSGQQNPQ